MKTKKEGFKQKYLMQVCIIAVFAIALAIFIYAYGSKGFSGDSKQAETSGFTFPYDLEDEKLEIKSLFPSDIPNPDKDFEEGVNLASIELMNKSEEYLKSADIIITLEDGTKLTFQIADIPAGKTVWAFDKTNTSIEADYICTDIQCDATFVAEDSSWNTQFQTSLENGLVKITNLTAEEKQDIKVIFHCLMEDVYFGGTSYEYTIEQISPNESATVEVIECYFGEPEAVQLSF